MRNEHIISINKDLCTGCGLCKKDCPFNSFNIVEKKMEIIKQDCIKCCHCLAICPNNAITISGFIDEPKVITKEMKVSPDILIDHIKSRRSIRSFTKDEVSIESINRIIEAGQYTPSGSNKQDVSYIVIKDNINEYEKTALILFRRLKKIIDIFTKKYKSTIIDDNFFFKSAPVAIVIKSSNIVDGALAASSMELMATSLGLGVLYSGFFSKVAMKSKKLKKKLKITSKDKIVTTLVIGYPAVKYQRTAPKEKPLVTFD